jgi:hypothetical protein
MRQVHRTKRSPDEIWCAAGSGMLARCVSVAFPDSQVTGVSVGLASRHSKQKFTSNVRLIESGYAFASPARSQPPFPSSANTTQRRGSCACGDGKSGRYSGMYCEPGKRLKSEHVRLGIVDRLHSALGMWKDSPTEPVRVSEPI